MPENAFAPAHMRCADVAARVIFDRSNQSCRPVAVRSASKADLRLGDKQKACRRIVTRYNKLAANHLAFVQRASIRLWLRANESS